MQKQNEQNLHEQVGTGASAAAAGSGAKKLSTKPNNNKPKMDQTDEHFLIFLDQLIKDTTKTEQEKIVLFEQICKQQPNIDLDQPLWGQTLLRQCMQTPMQLLLMVKLIDLGATPPQMLNDMLAKKGISIHQLKQTVQVAQNTHELPVKLTAEIKLKMEKIKSENQKKEEELKAKYKACQANCQAAFEKIKNNKMNLLEIVEKYHESRKHLIDGAGIIVTSGANIVTAGARAEALRSVVDDVIEKIAAQTIDQVFDNIGFFAQNLIPSNVWKIIYHHCARFKFFYLEK